MCNEIHPFHVSETFSSTNIHDFHLLGHYVYIEGSSPQLPGDTAKLISPVYTTNDGDACFTFWFNMYGTQIADLRLYK